MCWSWPSALYIWAYLSSAEFCYSQEQPALYPPPQLNCSFSADMHYNASQASSFTSNMESKQGCTETAQGQVQLLEQVKREGGAHVALVFSLGNFISCNRHITQVKGKLGLP